MRTAIHLAAMLGAALLAAPWSGARGAQDARMQISAITVFGASDSDVGSYADATGDAHNPGKFSVNPGKIWVEHIAEHYHLALTPYRALSLDKNASGVGTQPGLARVLGGNGYAEGGARVLQRPMQSGVGNNALMLSISQQVDAQLARQRTFAAGHLVIITGGGNDSYAQFASLCWGLDNNADGGKTSMQSANAAIAQAAAAQLANIRRIQAAGAGLILVGLAGDWSINPFGKKYLSPTYTGCAQAVTPAHVAAWTQQFNQILSAGLAGEPRVLVFDASDLYRAAIANPAAHGLRNVTDPACNNTQPTTSAAFCTRNTLVAPDADSTWLWSDSFHGTPAIHKLLADKAIALLDAVARPAQ